MPNLLDLKHKKTGTIQAKPRPQVPIKSSLVPPTSKQSIQPKTKEMEPVITEPVTRRSSLPVAIAWSGPLYYNFPNVRVLNIFIVGLYVFGVVLFYFQKNVPASIFFAVSPTLLLFYSKKQPPVVEFAVGPLSVKAGHREYKFTEMKSFWVEYNPGGIKELSIQLKKWYLPYFKIPLVDEDPLHISTILLKFVPEVEHEESLLDSISRILGM